MEVPSSSSPPFPHPSTSLWPWPPPLNPTTTPTNLNPLAPPFQPPLIPDAPHPPTSTPAAPTWSSLVSRTSKTTEFRALEFVEPIVFNGKPTASCRKSEIEKVSREWEGTLFGFLLGKRAYLPLLRKVLIVKWKISGSLDLMSQADGAFMLKFGSIEEKIRVLDQGPWFVSGRLLVLKPWRMRMKKADFDLSHIPIWIRLPNLPLEFWSKDSLSRIGSLVGKPLFSDEATASKSRTGFARICVEISAENSIPREVSIDVEGFGAFTQEVKLEWSPQICLNCKKFHSAKDCGKIPKTRQAGASKQIGGIVDAALESVDKIRHSQPMSGGRWEVVTKKKAGRRGKSNQSQGLVLVEGAETGTGQPELETIPTSQLEGELSGCDGPESRLALIRKTTGKSGDVLEVMADIQEEVQIRPPENQETPENLIQLCDSESQEDPPADIQENQVAGPVFRHLSDSSQRENMDAGIEVISKDGDTEESTLKGRLVEECVEQQSSPIAGNQVGGIGVAGELTPTETSRIEDSTPCPNVSRRIEMTHVLIQQLGCAGLKPTALEPPVSNPGLVSSGRMDLAKPNAQSKSIGHLDHLLPNPEPCRAIVERVTIDDASDNEDSKMYFPPGFTPNKEEVMTLRELMKEGFLSAPPEFQKELVKSVDLAEDGEIVDFFREKFQETTREDGEANYVTYQNVRRSPRLKKKPAKLSDPAKMSGLKKGFFK